MTQNRVDFDLELWKKQGFVNILLTHAGLVDFLNFAVTREADVRRDHLDRREIGQCPDLV